MDWIQSLDLGPELVYAVMSALVSGVLGWSWRGLSAKKEVEQIADSASEKHHRRVAELLEQIAERVSELETGNKAIDIISSARARNEQLRRDRYEQQRKNARETGRRFYRQRYPWWRRAWLRVTRR